MKQVLILASGEQARWEQEGKPSSRKQLLKLNGETIIGRIIRQCRERGVEPLVITHHSDIILSTEATCLPVEKRRWTVETLLSTWGWLDRTIVLLGDVIYSKTVMDRIFACTDSIRVFGNELEIFALSFAWVAWPDIVPVLETAITHAENGGPGKLRKFYQAYCGLDLDGSQMEDKIIDWVCHITDYTRDVDTPNDYKALLREVVNVGRLDDVD
jgi:hypothetical protein